MATANAKTPQVVLDPDQRRRLKALVAEEQMRRYVRERQMSWYRNIK